MQIDNGAPGNFYVQDPGGKPSANGVVAHQPCSQSPAYGRCAWAAGASSTYCIRARIDDPPCPPPPYVFDINLASPVLGGAWVLNVYQYPLFGGFFSNVPIKLFYKDHTGAWVLWQQFTVPQSSYSPFTYTFTVPTTCTF